MVKRSIDSGDSLSPDAGERESLASGSTMAQLFVGSVIDGKYRIDGIIGRGAMGLVVSAFHLQLQERVAIKFLRTERDVSDEIRGRFRREAKVSARLRNEHIARVIDVGSWRDSVLYMVMEHLDGVDLRKLLKKSGALPPSVALDYAVQICEGLAEAHAYGIVHRDLKPSNVFITKRTDGSDLVKILDFGISKWNSGGEDDDLTRAGAVLGSPKYMAPEQAFGAADVDARADVWTLGALLFEMLTGKPPLDDRSLSTIYAQLVSKPIPRARERRPELPQALDDVIARCLERDPDARIPNVADLAGDLLDAVEAPFADAVRIRIRAILDGQNARSNGTFGLSGSYGFGAPTGSYRPLVTTGSGSSAPFVLSQSPPPVRIDDAPDFAGERRRRFVAMGAIVGVALAIIGSGVHFASDGEAPTTTAAAASAAPIPVETHVVPLPAASPVAAPRADEAAPSNDAPAPPPRDTGRAVDAPAASAPPSASYERRRAWRPVYTRPAAPSRSAAPTPSPVAAPPPSPAPTESARRRAPAIDPLEDRQ